MARVVFLGTPRFAVPILDALLCQHQVVAVVTQPDRAGGRRCAQLYVPAVKQVAEAHGLRVLQPASLRRDRAAIEELRQARADVFVLAAFGQILRPEVLAIPPRGCIGVHASRLPRLRGAAPIPAAILQGYTETGITLMLTDAGMDTGPIIAQRSLAMDPRETTEALTEKLARLGAELLSEMLPAWLAGEIIPQPQDGAQATFVPLIRKEDGRIDWGRSAVELDRQIRAFTPWPGSYSAYRGHMLKVLRAHPASLWRDPGVPGTVLQGQEGIGVITGNGVLLLDTLQLAGKKAVEARSFARGQRGFVGSLLGQEEIIGRDAVPGGCRRDVGAPAG